MTLLQSYIQDDSGATAIEYGLIAALIAVAMIAGARSLGASITGLFSGVDSDIGAVFNG